MREAPPVHWARGARRQEREAEGKVEKEEEDVEEDDKRGAAKAEEAVCTTRAEERMMMSTDGNSGNVPFLGAVGRAVWVALQGSAVFGWQRVVQLAGG